jgi:uncharacterized protein YjbJ (UPF0337 family)
VPENRSDAGVARNKKREQDTSLVHLGESTFIGGNIMKSSTKDKIEGETDKIKGTVKEGLGKLTGNRDLEAEGKDDQLKGAVRKKIGEIKDVFDQ